MTATPEQIEEMCGDSIVRNNLLTIKNYSGYCGNPKCPYRWPRTLFDGEQFICKCGYRTKFPAEFIKFYLENRP